ncbi:bactofilin family protein [Lewinella cohaerens]|uniref:bactofilin family protein n=1 Tax=Lewinella cohaerens TaxID=70995 RepID=UPI00037617DD|nr:polymer-forming cytoskeletal protein [Lewinella cohaerens]
MFNKSGKKEMSSKSSPSPSPSGGHSLNSIVEGTKIEGTVNANSDIRVDGAIKGKLFCDAKVIIGPTGKVDGEIRCANAVVEGRFDGTMTVKELLNIRETAAVDGDITCGKLIVQPGGTIDGNLTMASGGKNSIAGSAKKAATEKTEKVAG